MVSATVRSALVFTFFIAFIPQSYPDRYKKLDPSVIARTHTLFFIGPENATVDTFRATLATCSRFTLSPSTRSADLILVLEQSNYGNYSNFNELVAHDPHTFAILGSVKAPRALVPNAEKAQHSVAQLMDTLLALDTAQPRCNYTVAPFAERSASAKLALPATKTFHVLGTIFAHPKTEDDRLIASAHNVFIAQQPFEPANSDPQKTTLADDLRSAIQSDGRFHIVTALDQADLLLTITIKDDKCQSGTGVPGGPDCMGQDYLEVDILDARSLRLIRSATQDLSNKPKALYMTDFNKLHGKLKSQLAAADHAAQKA